MEPSNVELKFREIIKNRLNYFVISKMNFGEYKHFVYTLFDDVNNLRKDGLTYSYASNIIHEQFYEVSDFGENDVLFERRFSIITEELSEFCSGPYFWQTDHKTYMKKWERILKSDWLVRV